MATDTLEKALVEVGRDPQTVGADLSIMRRHLRRKVQVNWTDELDGVFYGTIQIGGIEWGVDLCYRQKYDVYRMRIYIPQDHSPQIARRFDVQANNPYTCVNDFLVMIAMLRMMRTLDLDKD